MSVSSSSEGSPTTKGSPFSSVSPSSWRFFLSEASLSWERTPWWASSGASINDTCRFFGSDDAILSPSVDDCRDSQYWQYSTTNISWFHPKSSQSDQVEVAKICDVARLTNLHKGMIFTGSLVRMIFDSNYVKFLLELPRKHGKLH
eukprot:gb/GECG01009857.1/.p1 GENE.gb/GECG01009857.1/~~gb/GECG01009857.1/.p1  ORF type:complete len:146 (+),score=12.95 gb/GECG01009857.1/:1-438(+)